MKRSEATKIASVVHLVFTITGIPETVKQIIAFVCTLLVLSQGASAQINSDSLWVSWKNEQLKDSLRLNSIEMLIRGVINTDPDSALKLVNEQMEFADLAEEHRFRCQARLSRARLFAETGKPLAAVREAEDALRIAEEIKDVPFIGLSHNVLGIILGMLENHSEAIEHYVASTDIALKQNDTASVIRGYRNIGIAFDDIGNLEKAEEYYVSAFDLAVAADDKRLLPFVHVTLGNLYKTLGDPEKALLYYYKVLQDSSLIVNKHTRSGVYLSIAQAYRKLHDPQKAHEFYFKSLRLKQEINNKRSYGRVYVGIGRNYLDRGIHDSAIAYCDTALRLTRETRNLESEHFSCECLYQAYKSLEVNDSALRYHELVYLIKDSLVDIDREKEVNRKELGFAFEKQAMADSLNFAAKEAVMTERSKKQKIGLLAASGGLMLVLALALTVYSGKKKSDELLLNILPYETAQELKQKGTADAKLIDDVTVLFTDFKGFTAMSEQLSPKELVEDLNLCFSEFDRIMEKHGIEKIKTIGDAYMAACGLPAPVSAHAERAIEAAFEMRDFVEAGKQRKIDQGLPYFEIRIGVHTGPVVAGIVGIKKFQYDIWGDTVNTASRMESSGEVGKVNVSETTYEIIKDQYSCEFRGEIEAKGKGKLRMFFVEPSSA